MKSEPKSVTDVAFEEALIRADRLTTLGYDVEICGPTTVLTAAHGGLPSFTVRATRVYTPTNANNILTKRIRNAQAATA